MTGPDHYREAERLIGEAHENQFNQGSGDPVTPELLSEAQVHATLAAAAATALGREGGDGTQPSKDRAAWFDAAAECRKQEQS